MRIHKNRDNSFNIICVASMFKPFFLQLGHCYLDRDYLRVGPVIIRMCPTPKVFIEKKT